MTQSSSFIDINTNVELFESILPLDVAGSTSQAYMVNRGGEQFFMKQLRAEYLNDPRFRLIFEKEFKEGIQIEHPNIVRYKEWGENSQGPYILMEYVSGETLQEKLSNDPAYFRDEKHLEKLLLQLLDALHCLHEHHIVYCDLKPSNIMLTRINDDVKIVDLGFCDTDHYSFSAGMTEYYAAPEQQKKNSEQLDIRTDIYALGKLMAHIEKKRGKRLSPKYQRIMKRCLEKDMDKRFESTQELTKALKKKPAVTLSACLGCLLVLLAAFFIWQPYDRDKKNLRYVKNFLTKDKTVEGIYYKILSEDSATCMVLGRSLFKFKKDTVTKRINLYIRENIKIKDKFYRCVAIADKAFYESNVTSVHLPASLREIGEQAFYGNPLLSNIHIPEGVSRIGAKSFYKSGIESIKVSSLVKKIEHGVFAICKNLKNVQLPEGLESLGLDAFGECIELQFIELPSTLKNIDRGVFWRCTNLQKIEIPAGVESIGEYAFFYCDSLKDVYNYALEPQPLSVIFNRKDIRVHVPQASVEKYRQAQHWGKMIIVGDLP
ncbi:MAG: leucine-rich repeat protein [Bacteroidales bacterium]|nr:leucine-rich repeat protein [Bacteroidales bacterium]MBO5819320.1 leucine-rich repeat protein [Bacteroidales bacterium]